MSLGCDIALVIANTGQLIWHRASSRAVIHATWLVLLRGLAVDPPMTMSQRNKIPGNERWQEHVECVFEKVLAARGKLVRADVKIDVVGVAKGGLAVIRYLSMDWKNWRPFISAMCFINPLHFTHIYFVESDLSSPDSFAAFVASRCRAYVLSEEPLGVPAEGICQHGCNCYLSYEALNIECIMLRAWKAMLEWLERVHADPDYYEAKLVAKEVSIDELES